MLHVFYAFNCTHTVSSGISGTCQHRASHSGYIVIFMTPVTLGVRG
jgi:hypothetical protein